MKRFDSFLLILPFLTLIPVTGFTQCVYRTIPVSRVQGTVADPFGEPISNVDIRLKQDGKVIATAITDESGGFSLSASPGKYDLLADAKGFVPGFAQIDVGSDLIRMLKPAHLWMILDIGMVVDHCTFTATSRRQFEKVVQMHKQELRAAEGNATPR